MTRSSQIDSGRSLSWKKQFAQLYKNEFHNSEFTLGPGTLPNGKWTTIHGNVYLFFIILYTIELIKLGFW